jgi:hypothetical protein
VNQYELGASHAVKDWHHFTAWDATRMAGFIDGHADISQAYKDGYRETREQRILASIRGLP